ncbi:MAG: hypothetical protein PHC53_00460 [Patescibacteria group bacterium]|nr:hypothetical protein [Patescibacteria group bacterium]
MAITYHETSKTLTGANSDYTLRTVSVAGTTATVRAELASGGSADMTADCASGSVTMKGSSGLGAAVQGTTFKTTVVSSSGTFMPADVKAGSTWDSSETIRMDLTGSSAASMGPITVTTTEQSLAIGNEPVTVPAGTFTAMKVEIKRTSSSAAKLGKIPPSTEKSTEWWVKGVGMVKSVTIGPDGTSTIEAKLITGK